MAGDKEIMVVHVAVHASGNLSSFRTKSRTSSLQENHYYNAPHAGIGVGGEPSEAGSGVGAGSSFAEDFFFVEIEAQAAGSAKLHRSGHAVRQFGNDGRDIELPLHPRLKAGHFFRTGRMLEIVESSAIGD